MFINLTPHEITIFRGEEKITIPPSGKTLRLREDTKTIGHIDGIPTVIKTYSLEDNLPPQIEGVSYLVSLIVLPYIEGRLDFYAPDTGPESCVRDEQGRIVGVRRLICR
jgi:hypothetical protein